jgi:LCP family protein required for cell wall assembly
MSDTSRSPSRQGRPHLRRAFLAVSAIVSSFVMVIAAVSLGGYLWARGQIKTFDVSTPDDPSAVAHVAGRCAERACNYLLLGSDSRAGLTAEELIAFGDDEHLGGENRSDTIILVHTEPDRREAVFLSFPRDLWVEIPDVGMGKINTAFEGGIQGGGPVKIARVVKGLTGMQIHHVLYVDLAGFQGLVDALGGVDMCVPYPMYDPLSLLDIPAGCQHFDGRTALGYVRTRNQACDAVPDFARISRQQQFLRAVVSKLLEPRQLLRLPTLVPDLLDNFVVDPGLRNPADLVYLAGQLQGLSTDAAEFRAVPSVPAGTYVNGRYLSIVEIVQPDADELFRRIREGRPLGDLGAQLPSTPPSPANIVVAVHDRGADAATSVFDVLTDSGFDTSPGILPASGSELPAKGSFLLYREGEEAMARVVGSYLRNLDLLTAAPGTLSNGEDVAVVLGSRYELPPPETGSPVECP